MGEWEGRKRRGIDKRTGGGRGDEDEKLSENRCTKEVWTRIMQNKSKRTRRRRRRGYVKEKRKNGGTEYEGAKEMSETGEKRKEKAKTRKRSERHRARRQRKDRIVPL